MIIMIILLLQSDEKRNNYWEETADTPGCQGLFTIPVTKKKNKNIHFNMDVAWS